MAEPETAPENARSGIGASSSLPAIPAKVCLLNPQPALRLGGGNWYSCPLRAIRSASAKWRDRGGNRSFADALREQSNTVIVFLVSHGSRLGIPVTRSQLQSIVIYRATHPPCASR